MRKLPVVVSLIFVLLSGSIGTACTQRITQEQVDVMVKDAVKAAVDKQKAEYAADLKAQQEPWTEERDKMYKRIVTLENKLLEIDTLAKGTSTGRNPTSQEISTLLDKYNTTFANRASMLAPGDWAFVLNRTARRAGYKCYVLETVMNPPGGNLAFVAFDDASGRKIHYMAYPPAEEVRIVVGRTFSELNPQYPGIPQRFMKLYYYL